MPLINRWVANEDRHCHLDDIRFLLPGLLRGGVNNFHFRLMNPRAGLSLPPAIGVALAAAVKARLARDARTELQPLCCDGKRRARSPPACCERTGRC